MAKQNWFKQGDEGVVEAKRVDDDAARRRREAQDDNVVAKKRRLWMPPDSSLRFTFLDNVGLGI